MKEIKKFSHDVSSDIVNFQGAGGNISVKEEGKLWIKASGYRIADIFLKNALSCVALGGIQNEIHTISSDIGLSNLIQKNCPPNSLKPSIETGFHLVLEKYVLHTHNVYVNILLCMQGGDILLKKLFHEQDMIMLEYYAPGFGLFDKINTLTHKPKIIFLKNHGIILHANTSFEDLYTTLNNIENIVKQSLVCDTFVFQQEQKRILKHLFPDSGVIHSREIYSAHTFIKQMIRKNGAIPQYLTQADIRFLRNMSQEKYRQSLYNSTYKHT